MISQAAFIHDSRVVSIAAQVLFIAGLFQIFDGTQIVCVRERSVACMTSNFPSCSIYWAIGALPCRWPTFWRSSLNFGATGRLDGIADRARHCRGRVSSCASKRSWMKRKQQRSGPKATVLHHFYSPRGGTKARTGGAVPW